MSLTSEDKEWLQAELGASLGRVESDVAASLGRVESNMTVSLGRVESNMAVSLGRVESNMAVSLGRVESVAANVKDLESRLSTLIFDVAASVRDLESRLSTLIFDVAASVRDLESRLTAKFSADLEAVETKLLTEFHKWASPTEMRLRSNSLVMQAFDLELSNIKDRLNKLDPPIPPH